MEEQSNSYSPKALVLMLKIIHTLKWKVMWGGDMSFSMGEGEIFWGEGSGVRGEGREAGAMGMEVGVRGGKRGLGTPCPLPTIKAAASWNPLFAVQSFFSVAQSVFRMHCTKPFIMHQQILILSFNALGNLPDKMTPFVRASYQPS